MEIVQQDHPNPEETAFVYGRLRQHNAANTGEFPRKSLHLFAYGPDRQVIGGLFGDTGWGWLHIDILWVDAADQHQGLGGELLGRAEAEALTLEVDREYLETMSFQARPFYEKMGYEVFAELPDQPPGHTCYYPKKVSSASARRKTSRTALQAPLKGSELNRGQRALVTQRKSKRSSSLPEAANAVCPHPLLQPTNRRL